MTFSIEPKDPETEYSYIEEVSEPCSPGGPAHVPIKRFVEKPIQSTAEQLLTNRRFT